MRVTLLDLGIGNLHSLGKALIRVIAGASVTVETDIARAIDTELLVLPGVGAFPAAAARLAAQKGTLRDAVAAGLPCLGICVGMQVMFDASDEGPGEGLSFFSGRVTRLTTPRSPHMGWSPIAPAAKAPAWVAHGARGVYYAHSFACRPDDPNVVLATTELDGDAFAAIVKKDRVAGLQFHPEKSSADGMALLGSLARELVAPGSSPS
ncbi:imidazole glycerol phosphate synthase subunit HisH [Pendulispora albinea]|uniref:Imidazole glycerol phosphate synthase subunit HisH n=1 Tax=Pendulispora albinea TaxID=2741071 RepID=A0ABZ2M6L7_9BACT